MSEQGRVAGLITAANGISWVAAPALGMALYLVNPNLPFAASSGLLIALAIWARRRLPAL